MMAGPEPSFLSFDPRLVEETVLLAERSLNEDERRKFRAERDRLYSLSDPDERETRFAGFHSEWFVRLELGDETRELLDEIPSFGARPAPFSRCAVIRAISAKEEGADLHEERGRGKAAGKPALVIKVRPTTLLDAGRLRLLLRRDLLHVADMLDPAFEYSVATPEVEGGATREKIIRDRYRVLWDVSVDGRLVSRGMLGGEVEAVRRNEFLASFGALGREAAGKFKLLFHGPRPTHMEMWEMACAPGGAGLCPLCRFPTPVLQAAPGLLPAALIAAIKQEFPQWRPEAGLCAHCADLYASRPAALVAPTGP